MSQPMTPPTFAPRRRARAALPACALLASGLALAAGGPLASPGLPDTGQDLCWDGAALVACASANSGDAAAWPRQDGRYGRDAAAASGSLAKTGAGDKGFDYTKLDSAGAALANQNGSWSVDGSGYDNGSEGAGTLWSCVRDNATGLVWEVKTHTAVAGLRERGFTYTWYNSDGASNGGNAGQADTGAGVGSDNCLDNARCDTGKYVADVNAAALCGYTDWRLPRYRELLGLVHAGTQNPSIDAARFPSTLASFFWSASTYVPNPAYAWLVFFSNGYAVADVKTGAYAVRLVRGGQ